MTAMNRSPHVPTPPLCEPVRRAVAGPWAIELLPGAAYQARYVATQSAIGFAFDSQRGRHAIGSDRVRPFAATANGLAFIPAGCDVFSESPAGGEYLRLVRSDGAPLVGDQAFNNRVDPPAIALAQQMRRALLLGTLGADWEGWALALAARANGTAAMPQKGTMTARRLRLLDDFIDAGLDGPLSVQAMAQLLELSEGYFTRAFKLAMGKSPHSYLIDRRLARARSLLRGSNLGLAAIAQACGFASQAHMATAFRQRLGICPGQLRDHGRAGRA
ncbi:MAG: AraC family transcriptional regulator [Pseudomonas sp.]|uniref:helix-turn-helix transcriptional regulator n=1 Tax=Pseudomonas abieticivorans TaxID=2931382 RepID=UPI0020BFF9CB|nr:AraC family transcriptional regulator [Pseudomonas sp. PIA16]MDE1164538.1 AraC family transcriptional regulator [Pseudomonas sp.]